MKWEYMKRELKGPGNLTSKEDDDRIIVWLNKLGQSRWELIKLTTVCTARTWFRVGLFKRELQPKKKQTGR